MRIIISHYSKFSGKTQGFFVSFLEKSGKISDLHKIQADFSTDFIVNFCNTSQNLCHKSGFYVSFMILIIYNFIVNS